MDEFTKSEALIAIDDEGRPFAVDPDSNMLPRGASKDERDVHWLFNFAEGEMYPPVPYDIWDQSILTKRSGGALQVGTWERRTHFTTEQVDAAHRANRVSAAIERLSLERVRVLQGWAQRPLYYPEPLRRVFGRLAGVALRTHACLGMGGDAALVGACSAVLHKDKSGASSLPRHVAKVKLEAVRSEALAAVADAFRAYGRERAALAPDDDARGNALFERILGGGKR